MFCFGFSVSNFLFRIFCFGFSVSDFLFRMFCFGCSVSDFLFRIFCFGCSVSDFADFRRIHNHVRHIRIVRFKGTVSRDFRPSVFSLNCTPGSPDSCAKTVLHLDSNSLRYSIEFNDENRLRAMICGIARSQLPAVLHSAESTRKFLIWI
jgi:hypothetical protein